MGGASGGKLSDFKHELSGCGPFLHDDPRDRPPAIFGGVTSVYFGGGRAPFLLLPIIPAAKPAKAATSPSRRKSSAEAMAHDKHGGETVHRIGPVILRGAGFKADSTMPNGSAAAAIWRLSVGYVPRYDTGATNDKKIPDHKGLGG